MKAFLNSIDLRGLPVAIILIVGVLVSLWLYVHWHHESQPTLDCTQIHTNAIGALWTEETPKVKLSETEWDKLRQIIREEIEASKKEDR